MTIIYIQIENKDLLFQRNSVNLKAEIGKEKLNSVITLKEIADELGLSITTVSRAISGKGRVSEETRDRVLAAVEKHNYVPNDLARALRLKDTRSIGIITSDITNSFFASLVKGAESIAQKSNYSVLVSNSNENPKIEEQALELMRCKQINGLILATVGGYKNHINQYEQQGIPIVFVDNMPNILENYNSVSMGNIDAAVTITRELIDRGYKKIGMVTGSLNQSTGYDRLKGYKLALEKANLPINKDWIFEGNFKVESGKESMQRLLKQNNMPDAMIFANNYMAYGGVKYLQNKGINIPKDIAIAGFDIIDPTGLVHPKISSINQNPTEIGVQAAKLLIEKIENISSVDSYSRVVLKPEISDGTSW